MEEDVLNIINNALDDAMQSFIEDPDLIFTNEKERMSLLHSDFKELKKWKKNQNCIVKGCPNKSIERSHTIPKSSAIKIISEDGHTFTPYFDEKTGHVDIKKVGINEASTFPGYCLDHEKLFFEFEQKKQIENGEHFGLQIYRTICREIVISESHLKRSTNLVKAYKDFRDKKVKEAFINKLPPELLNMPNLEFVDFQLTSNDYRLQRSEEQIKEIKRYLKEFLYTLQDAILSDLKKKRFNKVAYVAINFDRQIPVALAGHGNFFYKLKTKTKEIETIFNVLPSENRTLIFICTLKKHERELKHYMDNFINPLQSVSLVENWMIHGSDHWFIRPSVWKAIKTEFQIEILQEILDIKYNIGNELNLTIFNSNKLESIKLMEDNYESLTEPLKILLAHEKGKLTMNKC